ncbi:MAG: hypothetical protein EB145_11175 [Proteobacteria bacterium]|nr:hypothetical protein [Pseudomonadota bacterium]
MASHYFAVSVTVLRFGHSNCQSINRSTRWTALAWVAVKLVVEYLHQAHWIGWTIPQELSLA